VAPSKDKPLIPEMKERRSYSVVTLITNSSRQVLWWKTIILIAFFYQAVEMKTSAALPGFPV